MSAEQRNRQKEKVIIVGYGWVGQANALGLTSMGYQVWYYDLVEPQRHYEGDWSHLYERVKPVSNLLEHDGENTWYLISVGDRVKEDGVQDISLIEKACNALRGAKGGVVLRSTVLPEHFGKLKFDYYLPEFLHEKQAVEECLNPFYFVVGTNTKRAEPSFFAAWEERSHKVFRGAPEQASHIKYLSNIWNALRIAFVNEFGDIVGDPERKEGVAEIERIVDFVLGKKNYLRYGKGYGGHCLPKDVLAFSSIHARTKNARLLSAIHDSNAAHEAHTRARAHVPEWFSSWVNEDAQGRRPPGYFAALRLRVNALPAVRAARKQLRFIVKGFERMVPDRSLPEARALWNALAIKNARYFVNPGTPSGQGVHEFELRETGLADYKAYVGGDALVREKLGDFSGKKALHLGCGIGRVTEFLAQGFAEVCAVDISDGMIAQAKKRLLGTPNVSFAVTDGASVPFPAGSFDFCFSHQTFQYVPRKAIIQRYFEDIFRTLKQGGVAKVQVRTGLGVHKWKYSYGVSFTEDEARRIAEEAGFIVLRCEPEKTKHLWLTLIKE